MSVCVFFFFQAEDGIRDGRVTGVRRVLFRSLPAKSAPASSASLALSGFAMTRTRFVLPVPPGMTTEPRTIWSAYFGLTRSEERRVGKECRSRWSRDHLKKK